MVEIKLDSKFNPSQQLSEIVDRHLPFVTARALTVTANGMKDEIKNEMLRVFDNPTRYTLNSQLVIRAEKTDDVPKAELTFRSFGSGTPAYKYLRTNALGGGRRHKRYERALIANGYMFENEYTIPGKGARLNSHGNITGGQINQMLSQLRSQRSDFRQNATNSKRSRQNRSSRRYFILRSGNGFADRSATRGIYTSTGRNRKAKLFLRIVQSPPQYDPTFDYFGVGKTYANSNFPRIFNQSLEQALETSR